MRRRLLTAPVLAAALAAGCAPAGVLVAHSGEHRLRAHDEPSGVTVVLTSAVWSGTPADLETEWTVLHVLVANLGDEPLLLAPGDFELRDERGFHYELLDPGAVFRLADEPQPAAPYGRSYHRDYDPGGPVEFEPIVPPGQVAERALPWGVLEPGTQMRGFVYFEKVEANANAAQLVWHLRRPDHQAVADLRFDLYVARDKTKAKTKTKASPEASDEEQTEPEDAAG